MEVTKYLLVLGLVALEELPSMSALPTHLAYFVSIRSFIHMEGVKLEEYYELFLHMHNNAGRFAIRSRNSLCVSQGNKCISAPCRQNRWYQVR